MQTVRKQNMKSPGFSSSISNIPVSENQAKRLKIREFISWAACFAVITGLTGMLKILKVGITMDSVTSWMFYLSIVGLVYFIFRIISISRNPVQMMERNQIHELN